ncbi:UNKNOWN [Stylonychia lemnae]|uniref:Homeobox domain-containing protein n=1 Tax=Stylonychia lemnae TaxID=5949 RepID=A0A078A715_STYLE|nr:UNKNOWN [Stylonychia lemnae]|eukprot:CDW77671.1 UNKNOWN [Stylonychia lemnae]
MLHYYNEEDTLFNLEENLPSLKLEYDGASLQQLSNIHYQNFNSFNDDMIINNIPLDYCESPQSKIKNHKVMIDLDNDPETQSIFDTDKYIHQWEPRNRKNIKVRKSKLVYETFDAHYRSNPNWSRDLVVQLSQELGLTTQQVYKWNWDKKKRDRLKALKNKIKNRLTKKATSK